LVVASLSRTVLPRSGSELLYFPPTSYFTYLPILSFFLFLIFHTMCFLFLPVLQLVVASLFLGRFT
jgi:hypothetical protein